MAEIEIKQRVTLGTVVGTMGALVTARILASWLPGVTAFEPLPIAVATLVLATVAAIACYLPARRAARVDPMVALRSD